MIFARWIQFLKDEIGAVTPDGALLGAVLTVGTLGGIIGLAEVITAALR